MHIFKGGGGGGGGLLNFILSPFQWGSTLKGKNLLLEQQILS